MDRFKRANALLGLVLFGLCPAAAGAQGFAGRPDAPKKPDKGEYTWAEPKDWTPPTLEELRKLEWKDGRITTSEQLEKERAAAVQRQISEAEALALANDGKAANDKILSALGRPPKSDEEVDWDATINRVADGAPNTLNYVLSSSLYETQMCTLLSPELFNFDHQMRPFADGELVSAWKTSPTVDMVTLRDDLVWEDGTSITAYDAEFSYHAVLDDHVNVPAWRAQVAELKWVKAYDAHTLVYFHKAPLATNVWNTELPILPKHIYSPGLAADPTMQSSEWNVYWNLHPLSGGPYRVKEHQTGQYLLLERRESWYQDKSGKKVRAEPYAKLVRFRIIQDENAKLLSFKKGDVDEFLLSARQWAAETGGEDFRSQGVKVRGTEWSYAYIGWNQRPIPDAPFFKDKRVRLAMTYALDHKELIDKIYFGLYEPGAGPFHPESWMASPANKPFEQDLDKAEALLDEAGWKDSDGDGVRDKTVDGKKWQFEFTLLYGQGSPLEKAAVLLKENLDSIGVKMDIKALEFASLQQAVFEHRFQAQAAGWGTGTDPDTANNLWKTEMYEKGRNYVGYSNAEVDRLFDEGAKELDFEKRKAIYQRIDQLIWEDQPYTFLYYRGSLWAFSKRLRGYAFSPRGPFSYSPGFGSVWVPKKAS
jgi:peptide/nickel transport system substrate-binding protein